MTEERSGNSETGFMVPDFQSVTISVDEPSSEAPTTSRSSQAWAMLIKRVYEVDLLCCPESGGQMQVVSFIEPPQADVIEAILTHCGLWESRSPRAPPEVDEWVLELDAAYSADISHMD